MISPVPAHGRGLRRSAAASPGPSPAAAPSPAASPAASLASGLSGLSVLSAFAPPVPGAAQLRAAAIANANEEVGALIEAAGHAAVECPESTLLVEALNAAATREL